VAGVDLVEGMPLHPTEVVVAGVLVEANAISGLVLISLVLLKVSLWVLVVLVVLESLLIAHWVMLEQLAQPLPLPILEDMAGVVECLDLHPQDLVALHAHPFCFSIQVLAAIVGLQEIQPMAQMALP
jgi:hypothetical protein